MKINFKRLLLSFMVVLVLTLAFNHLLHAVFLKPLYEQTASLWRTDVEMQGKLHWLMFGQLIIAYVFTLMFAKGYEGRGLAEGVRFGLLVGALCSGGVLITYAVQPLPSELVGFWILGDFIKFILAGVAAALIYRPVQN